MRKKVEDYELFPESEGTEKQIILWNKWRDKWKHKNKNLFDIDPSAALAELQNYMDDKRRRKLKQVDDRVEYNEFEAAGKLFTSFVFGFLLKVRTFPISFTVCLFAFIKENFLYGA